MKSAMEKKGEWSFISLEGACDTCSCESAHVLWFVPHQTHTRILKRICGCAPRHLIHRHPMFGGGKRSECCLFCVLFACISSLSFLSPCPPFQFSLHKLHVTFCVVVPLPAPILPTAYRGEGSLFSPIRHPIDLSLSLCLSCILGRKGGKERVELKGGTGWVWGDNKTHRCSLRSVIILSSVRRTCWGGKVVLLCVLVVSFIPSPPIPLSPHV